ncbi:MAG: undecaprenyl-diphosphate phosphatase [Candidatus Heimdallarchaeota archaeon]|nr:undecaprenyl-diphosphate phosphatase [Candidatus Heimdallarchaeota archaeon]
MVDVFQTIIFSILQGIIEWLPISSEGQLSLFFINVIGMSELEAITLAILLHLGTMISVIWVFRADFIDMLDLRNNMTRFTIVATFGTAISAVPIVFFLKDFWEEWTALLPIDTSFLFTVLIGLFLIFTGFILSKQPKQGSREINLLTQDELIQIGFFVGLAQGFSALPGISRSGMTITTLLFFGLIQKDALKTSFIISVPAVLGATGLEFLLTGFTLQSNSLLIGAITYPYELLIFTILLTAIVGVLTMEGLLKLKSLPYDKFCIGFGTFTVVVAIFLNILIIIF